MKRERFSITPPGSELMLFSVWNLDHRKCLPRSKFQLPPREFSIIRRGRDCVIQLGGSRKVRERFKI